MDIKNLKNIYYKSILSLFFIFALAFIISTMLILILNYFNLLYQGNKKFWNCNKKLSKFIDFKNMIADACIFNS